MKALKTINIALAGSLLLTSFDAFAGVVSSAADWTLSESGDQCLISTNNNTFGDDNNPFPNQSNINFSIIKYKNKPDMPVELMVQFVSNNNSSKSATVSVSGTTLALPDLDGRKSNFWAIPKNLSNLIQQIKGGRDITVKGVGGRRSEDLKLSTRGFNDMLKAMESRCNSGTSLVNAEFESVFLANVADSIDPTRIDSTKTQQLRSIYYAAYKAAFNVSNASVDLAKLLAKYQPYIDELALNRSQAKQIEETDLPATRNTLANAKQQQVDATAEIARINGQIPGLTAKIQVSQKAYDEARAILTPLEPEYNRITENLSSAQTTLREAQSRLSYIETRLRDGAQQISSLDSEARNIEYRLPQKRSDLDRARSILRDAQSRRANFNVSWERESRLRNHYEYSRLQSDRQNMTNSLRQAEMDLQRVRSERDRIARDLQQCRSGMIGFEIVHEPRPPGGGGDPGSGGGLVPGNPGGGGLVPGNPGNPGNPNPPPPPPRDCSYLEQALNNANNMVSQKESEQRNLANRVNEINSRIYQIERQVDSDVRREYDSLVYAEDQARRENDRIENDVNNDQNRLSQIRSSDIPRLEREQSQLQSEKPSAVSRISESTAAVSRLSQELTSFKASTGWDRKAGAVETTGSQLGADQGALEQALSNKKAAQNRLEQGAALEAQTKAQIDSLNSQLAALNKRAGELNEILKKLPEERAQFDITLAAQRAELVARTSQFLDLLK